MSASLVRVLSSPAAVVRAAAPPSSPAVQSVDLAPWGGGAYDVVRDRRGVAGAAYNGVLAKVLPPGAMLNTRLLTPEQYWRIYRTTPDVRSCVDKIVRRIASWDWRVYPDVDPRDKEYEDGLAVCAEATRWLEVPNTDGETWQEVWTKALTDLLVQDATAIELVSSRGKQLAELNVLAGQYVYPRVSEVGRVEAYVQDPFGQAVASVDGPYGPDAIEFKPVDMLYLRAFPTSQSPLGTPLLESLVNECVAILLASDHVVTAMDADEIPPGILVVGGIADVAVEEARADLQRMRGKDHKVRVIASPVPGQVDAKWVKIDRRLRDVEMAGVNKEIQRTIWRTFGVLPAEQGDTEATPRATASVQMDVGQSYLIEPLLELVAAKINARILPRLLPEKWVGRAKFEFIRDRKLTPAETKDRRTGHSTMLHDGAMTINEVRQAEGLAPYGKEGDVPLVWVNGVPTRLVDLVAEKPEPPPAAPPAGDDDPDDPEPAPEPDDAGNGDGGGVEEDDETSQPEEAAPGENDGEDRGERTSTTPTPTPHVHGPGCDHRASLPSEDDLPSDWQPAGRLAGYRTLDLPELGRLVVSYREDVVPLYADALQSVLGAVRRHHRAGATSADAAGAIRREAGRALDRLAALWDSTTRPYYRATASGAAKATEAWTTHRRDASDVERRADAFQESAMGYLVAEGGLLRALEQTVEQVAARIVAPDAETAEARSDDHDALFDQLVLVLGEDASDVSTSAAKLIAGLTYESSSDDVARAVEATWRGQAHRIENWSGKLVELANDTMRETLSEAALAENTAPDRPDDEPLVEWWGEWVAVGDSRMCGDCLNEGLLGFRPLSAFTRVPGQTACLGRDRCVITVWTREEIDSGKAVSLSGAIVGNTIL